MAAISTTSKLPTYVKELLHVPQSVDRNQWKVYGLTPIELSYQLCFTISLCFFYDAEKWTAEGKSKDEFMNLTRMKESLTQLLRYYPIIASRLIGPDGPADEARLENIDHGISFESGESSYRLNELPIGPEEFYVNDPATSPELSKFLISLSPPYDFMNPLASPLFQVRYTRLACGSVCLGVHMHHHVCDMESYMNFMKDWSELYQQLTLNPNSPSTLTLVNPPSLDRSWLACTKEQLEESRVNPKPIGFSLMSGNIAAPLPTVARAYRFTAKELAEMKRAAESELKLKEGEWLSTFEVLTAHLLRCVYRARNPHLTDEMIASTPVTDLPALRLDVPTNLRKRLETSPPARVFCNAVLPTPYHFSTSLITSSLSSTALEIHRGLHSTTPASWRGTMSWLQNNPEKDRVIQTIWKDLPIAVLLSAWNKFGGYQIAFEPSHPPARICMPWNFGVDGVCDILDTELPDTKDGQALDVYMCLPYEVANRLVDSKELHQFRL